LQVLVQTPTPLQLAVQSFLHPASVQVPTPEQLIVQPLPGQLRTEAPAPSLVEVHVPRGQLKVQEPVAWHSKLQPGPLQVRTQAPIPVQTHGLPGLQVAMLGPPLFLADALQMPIVQATTTSPTIKVTRSWFIEILR
jgi:hypothetical protein